GFVNGDIVTCEMTSNATCATPATVTSAGTTMTVHSNVTPAITIALTSGSNPACAGSPLIFTATPSNGGTNPSYQWMVNGSNAGTNSNTYSSSSLVDGDVVSCQLTSNAACASPVSVTSSDITMSVNAH